MDTVMESESITSTTSSTKELDTKTPEKHFTNLTAKQIKFVESYIVNGQGKLSAVNAGYPESQAASIGWQLLKNPKILTAIDSCRTKLRANFTKENYIDKALDTFEKLDITEPNSPRFYDIAGKALGYIGNGTDNKSITNNTQINIAIDTANLSTPDLINNIRRMLSKNT